MRAALAALVVLAGCPTPTGPWHVSGPVTNEQADQALQLVQAARAVTPDDKGWLAMGGEIHFGDDLAGLCLASAGRLPTGCSQPGQIEVLLSPERGLGPDLTTTALAHELAHLGLERGGGCPPPFCAPLRQPTEAEADAAAAEILTEYRRTTP